MENRVPTVRAGLRSQHSYKSVSWNFCPALYDSNSFSLFSPILIDRDVFGSKSKSLLSWSKERTLDSNPCPSPKVSDFKIQSQRLPSPHQSTYSRSRRASKLRVHESHMTCLSPFPLAITHFREVETDKMRFSACPLSTQRPGITLQPTPSPSVWVFTTYGTI